MLYAIKFKPTSKSSSNPSAGTVSSALNLQSQYMNSTKSACQNLEHILSQTYNAIVYLTCKTAVQETGFRVRIQDSERVKIELLSGDEIGRNQVLVDVLATGPTGDEFRLNDENNPVVATWEPEPLRMENLAIQQDFTIQELQEHFELCFPAFYGAVAAKQQ